MPTSDSGFKIVAHASGRQLAEVAGVVSDEWTPLVSEVQTTERFADRAFRARRGPHRFVVYMEAYTFWQREAPWNLLTKSSLLSERERLPTVCLVYVLRRRRYRKQHGRFRLAVGDDETQLLHFREICLWEQRPQPWWEQSPGLMALYPLCHHGMAPHRSVTHAAGAIQEAAADGIQRADLLTTLAIFGRLAYRDLDVFRVIGREQMKESPLYEEIKDEGRLETLQASILDNLDVRFGSSEAGRVAEAVRGIADLDRLKQLHRLAAACDSMERFTADLTVPARHRRRR